jgi:hypothetical protein
VRIGREAPDAGRQMTEDDVLKLLAASNPEEKRIV